MMKGTMKCAIYKDVKNIVVETRDIPTISSHDILVKNLRAGICGSDIGIYLHGGTGYGLQPNSQFGHEMVSQVVEIGEDVQDDIQIGDIVFVDPTLSTENGAAGSVMAGAFSEYAVVKNAKVNYNIYPLDKNCDLDTMAIIEPFCVGTKAATMIEPTIDEKVVILGAGTIGLCAAASLLARGLTNVVVVDRDENRLSKAKTIGAMVVNTTTEDLKEALIRLLGTFPGYFPVPDVDMYIEAAGSKDLLKTVFDYAREKTRYCVVSMMPEITINGIHFISTQPMIYGSRGYEHANIIEVIDCLKQRKTKINEIITSKYSLDDFPEAISAASSGKEIKVIIDFEK